jgi:hypothetical protein
MKGVAQGAINRMIVPIFPNPAGLATGEPGGVSARAAAPDIRLTENNQRTIII